MTVYEEQTSSQDQEDEPPQTVIHPPTVFIGSLIAGYILRLVFGGTLPIPRALADAVGGLLLIASVIVFASTVSVAATHAEELKPGVRAPTLLTTGAYRFSRNPLYLAMVLFGVGFAIATVDPWIVFTTAIVGAVFHFLIVLPQELYLSRRFGEEYTEYSAKVRRWI